VKKTALSLALALAALAIFALLVEERFATCPGRGGFTCATLVRPALRSLFFIPIAPVFFVGAGAQALAALLLLRKTRERFARDVARASALGAGFALGLQPLALLVTRAVCPFCLAALVLQLALALTFAKIARAEGARAAPLALAFLVALAATGPGAIVAGMKQRARDEEALARLAKLERSDARLVLLERDGCPYCEALLLDVLSEPHVLARLERTGLARRSAKEGEPAPVLLGLDQAGREVARETGFSPESARYEAVFEAARR